MQPLGVTAAAAATAALSAFVWSRIDCNPSLFVFDKFLTSRRNNFRNQCIWIIGASSGIGEELAYQLVVDGDKSSTVITTPPQKNASPSRPAVSLILSSRNEQKLQKVRDKCLSINPDCSITVLPLDVCNEQDVEAAVQAIPNKIDCAVLNAGGGHLSPALETTAETAKHVWKLNALWPMVITPLLFRYNVFKKDRPPTLVVTSSIAAKLPVPLSATYAAAKHAQLGYFRSLNAERPDIRLHMVLPGPIDTDFHQNHHGSSSSSSRPEKKPSPKPSNNKLKMPADRCARLIRSAMLRNGSTESWIATQPTLTALYIHHWAPGLMQRVLQKIGVKRVAMFKAGLDLYDPASWKKQLPETTEAKKGS